MALVAATGATVVSGPAAAAAGPRGRQPVVSYVPPVEAPVSDPFRAPAGPYAPGNRGIEYDTEPGGAVVASADGVVAFAGPVGGALHVTLSHTDGVRTSYSFLATVEVVTGQQVRQGDRIGGSGDQLHFGARAGARGDYFDPAGLFAGTAVTVELLPLDTTRAGANESGALTEADALARLAAGSRGAARATGAAGHPAVPEVPGLGTVVGWLRSRARTGLTYAVQLAPAGRGLDLVGDLADRLSGRRQCSTAPPPDRPVAGQDRLAVTVAGLGSTSDTATIDELRLDELGYTAGRVVRFSYAGGHTPGTGRDIGLAGPDARPYASVDTQGDVGVAGGRLADLIEQLAAARPGVTVDVYAHSLGGLVTRSALVELDGRGFDLGRLGLVTTLASPHGGADLATAVVAANGRLGSGLVLEAVEGAAALGLDPDAVAVAQMAEHSDTVRALAAAGVPPEVRLVSIAARGDLVVAAPRTEVPGAVNITVPVAGRRAHGDVVSSDAATAEMARALAGHDPGCEAWDDVVADVLAGHAVSAAEDHLGAIMATVG